MQPDNLMYGDLLAAALQRWLAPQSDDERRCTVLFENQNAPLPPHPYVTLNRLASLALDGGGYCEAGDGTMYRTASENWSVTAHSDRADEAAQLAARAHDFLSLSGRQVLAEVGMVVRRVGAVTNRASWLTTDYEHRAGLDAVIGFIHRGGSTRAQQAGVIETAPPLFTNKEETDGA